MAPKRTERSRLLTTEEIPASAGVPLCNVQNPDMLRQHFHVDKGRTLPDMIQIKVRPGPDKGSWNVEVWECPDEQ